MYGTYNLGPGRHLPESFPLLYSDLSLRCLKAIFVLKKIIKLFGAACSEKGFSLPNCFFFCVCVCVETFYYCTTRPSVYLIINQYRIKTFLRV